MRNKGPSCLEPAKYEKAADLLESLWDQSLGALSMQVLQEFYVNVTRQIAHPLPRESAREVVDACSIWCVETTPAELKAAFRIEDEAASASGTHSSSPLP